MICQDSKTLLEVRGLCATVSGIEILKGIDLTVRTGEVHAIMGPNGSGKTTLAYALLGQPAYLVKGDAMNVRVPNLDLAEIIRFAGLLSLARHYRTAAKWYRMSSRRRAARASS